MPAKPPRAEFGIYFDAAVGAFVLLSFAGVGCGYTLLSSTSWGTLWFPALFAGLAALALVRGYDLVHAREVVRVSPAGVRIPRRSPFFSRAYEISADALEEVEASGVSTHGSLVLYSDERRLICARGVSPEERAWLRDLIGWVLAKGEAPELDAAEK